MSKVYIFDLDDTIVECQVNYFVVLSNFIAKMVDVFGRMSPHPKDIAHKQHEIDVVLMKEPFSKERFPKSLVKTYQYFHREIYGNENYDKKIEEEIFAIGDSVYKVIPKPLPNAIETLAKLKEHGKILCLYTLGDKDVQMYKILNNRLYEIFDPDKIFIRKKKTVEELEEIYNYIRNQYGIVDKSEFTMVGDNLKTDIIPALEFGINAIKVRSRNPFSAIEDEFDYKEVDNISEIIWNMNPD